MTVAITRLRPFQPLAVTGDQLTWRHLAASCSVPVIMPPCRLPEGLGVDGGLLTSVPAWAALDAGYERIVAVNILPGAGGPVLKSLKRVMCALGRFDPKVDSSRPSPKVVWVEPSRPLGPLFLSAIWDPKRALDWVDLGRHDAQDVLRRINQWSQLGQDWHGE
jgi:predicted acylesterase/phospholipase RssA